MRLGPPVPQEGSWLSPNKELRGMCLQRETSVDQATGTLTLYQNFKVSWEWVTFGARPAVSDIPRVEEGVKRPRRADEMSHVFPVVSS